MITNKKLFSVICFLALSLMGMTAQTGYYYKGEKIPLTVSGDKVCVSLPKTGTDLSGKILSNAIVQSKISDPNFDIFVVQQSDVKKTSASDAWAERRDSVIVSSCYRTVEGTEVYSTPYLNIRLKAEQDTNLLSQYANQYGLEIVKRDALLPMWFILSVNPGNVLDVVEIANALWESGDFAASVPDLCSSDDLCSNDPLFDEQWGLRNNVHPGIDISVTDAWNYATGKDVKIAILDTGVDLNHVDLKANMSGLSYDTESGSSPSVLYDVHGTHCAGIAAAVKDNGIHIAGVAPDAKIISISAVLTSASSRLKRADGIVWAYQHGADIISNSWSSGTKHEAIDEAIRDAFTYGRHGKGCVIVFASGNSSPINKKDVKYPANSNDTILAVGAIVDNGERADFSHYGETLDLVAPGDDILSTMPFDQADYSGGTSMACPHVAGVAALILERNPELTVNQVNSIICRSVKKLPGVDFGITKAEGTWNPEYGYGLVDAYGAVMNTPSAIYIQNETLSGEQTITADNILVGKDVTGEKPQGEVTLGPGNITLKAKTVTIKNSTTVPLGTTLKILNK